MKHKTIKPNKVTPLFQIDLARVPKDFSIEKIKTLIKSQGVQIYTPKYILEEVESKVRLSVSKDVIDFLELHDIETIGDDKYYKINNIKYKVINE